MKSLFITTWRSITFYIPLLFKLLYKCRFSISSWKKIIVHKYMYIQVFTSTYINFAEVFKINTY